LDGLAANVEFSSASQADDYAIQAWECFQSADAAQVYVVTVEGEGELMCVWPLIVQESRFLSVASHPSCGSNEEFANPLIAIDALRNDIARWALDAARTLADAVSVFKMDGHNPLIAVIDEVDIPQYRTSINSPVMSLSSCIN
jgi:CelD/BcsL family acetyltransferase involved in cellulose biosynthesis